MLPNRASAIRGFSIHHLILDEIGSWPQNSSLGCTVPQVLQASRARMAAEFPRDYRILMLTTRPPGYNAFIEGLIEKPPVNFTVVKASTLKMRPEFKADQFQHISRCEYLREIECERVTDSEEAVIPIDLLVSCEVPAELLDRDRIIGGRTLISVDQAFKHDYAAIAVITRTEERYYVHEFIRRRLNGSVPSLIALTKNTSEKYGNAPVIIDQHGSDSLSQLLREQGLNVRVQHWNNDNRESAFSNLRYLLEQKKIALPKNDALREEIVSLIVKRTPGGKRRIEGGTHDDLTFALLAGLESVKSRVLAPEVMMW
jgi:phage terminase large subunit-like protein